MLLDKTLNKFIAFLLVLNFIIWGFIGSFMVKPVFADDSSPFVRVPSPSSHIFSENLALSSYSNGQYVRSVSSDSEVFAFLYVSPNFSDRVNVGFVSYTSPSSVSVSVFDNGNFGWSGSSYRLDPVSGYDFYGNVSYGEVSNSTYTQLIQTSVLFDSFSSGYSSFSNWYQNSSSSGEFYTFPQSSSDTLITYEYIEGNGVMVYSSPNTYHLMGVYNSSSTPLSQYCYIDNGDGTSNFAVFSSVPLTVYSAFLNGETYTYSVCSEYDSGKYYYVFPELIQSEIENSFSSLVDAQSAFAGASSGEASGSVSAGKLTIQLPAGNVLYVKPRSGSLARLDVQFPVLSATSSPYWSSRNSTAKWISGVSSLPDENTKFPLSGMSDITWSVDSSKGVDGYGRGYYGYTSHAPFNAGWFVVYNPTYTRSVTDDTLGGNTATYNPTITVTMQYASEYYIYDLSEKILPSGNESSSDTDYSSNWSGSYNETSDQWDKTSTGTSSSDPVIGGQNAGSSGAELSIVDYLQQLKQTLSNFASSFIELLKAPISHIQQLISAGTDFFNIFAQMFTWLPSEVYSVLVSALILIIVIGVIKLLHR